MSALDDVDNAWRKLDAMLINNELTIDHVLEQSKLSTPSRGASYIGDRMLRLLGQQTPTRTEIMHAVIGAARDMGQAFHHLVEKAAAKSAEGKAT